MLYFNISVTNILMFMVFFTNFLIPPKREVLLLPPWGKVGKGVY